MKPESRLRLVFVLLGVLASAASITAASSSTTYSSTASNFVKLTPHSRGAWSHKANASEVGENAAGYVVPLLWLPDEKLPDNLAAAEVPPALVTISFALQGVIAEQFKNSTMQRTLQDITAKATGTPSTQWTIHSSSKPAAPAQANALQGAATEPVEHANALPLDVFAAWGQCGGLGGVCGDRPGFDCQDGPFLHFSCPEGHICKRQSKWHWQCAEDPAVRVEAADPSVIAGWKQCGGKGGKCQGDTCADAAYPGYSCVAGYTCMRKMEWYWQCMPEYMLPGRKLLDTDVKQAPQHHPQQHQTQNHSQQKHPEQHTQQQQQSAQQQPHAVAVQQAQQPAQQQVQQQLNGSLAVTMSLSAYKPQLVVHRLSQPAAAADADSTGCTTAYCYMLTKAGVPVDGNSMNVQPDIGTLMAQAGTPQRTTQRTTAAPRTQSAATVAAPAAEERRSSSGVDVRAVVGAIFGGLLLLLLLVLGKKVKDRCQASAAIAPQGPLTAESSSGSASESAVYVAPEVKGIHHELNPAAQMTLDALRSGGIRPAGETKQEPQGSNAAPVAYTGYGCSITAAAAAIAAANNAKNATVKPEMEDSFNGEITAGPASKLTKTPSYPNTPSPQSSDHESPRSYREASCSLSPATSGASSDSGRGHFEHTAADTTAAYKGNYTGKGSSVLPALGNHEELTVRRFLSGNEIANLRYSSSDAAAKTAEAAAAAALDSDEAASYYSMSNTPSYHSVLSVGSCRSSLASATVPPAAVHPDPENITSHMLLDVESTFAGSLRSSVASVATANGAFRPDGNGLVRPINLPEGTRLTSYALASLGPARTTPHYMFATPTASHASESAVRASMSSLSNTLAASRDLLQLLNSPTAAARFGLPASYPRPGGSVNDSSVQSSTANHGANARTLSPIADDTLTPWA